MSETETLRFHQAPVPEDDRRKLGLDGATTRLAVATVNDQGQVEYDASPVTVAEKVKTAKRILLYIHASPARRAAWSPARAACRTRAESAPVLADRYDLILAYDYESINTSVEQTAIKLKEHLKAVGWAPGTRRRCTSSAIPSVQWSRAGSSSARAPQGGAEGRPGGPPHRHAVGEARGLDHRRPWHGDQRSGPVIWPPAAIPALVGTLASLVAGVEKVDTTLDQLKPGSDFYAVLNMETARAWAAGSRPRTAHELHLRLEPGKRRLCLLHMVAAALNRCILAFASSERRSSARVRSPSPVAMSSAMRAATGSAASPGRTERTATSPRIPSSATSGRGSQDDSRFSCAPENNPACSVIGASPSVAARPWRPPNLVGRVKDSISVNQAITPIPEPAPSPADDLARSASRYFAGRSRRLVHSRTAARFCSSIPSGTKAE